MQQKKAKSRRPSRPLRPSDVQTTRATRGPLRVCVAIQDDGLSGIESYAEQVAIASASAGHDTTLIVTTKQVANAVRARLASASFESIKVVDTGIKPRTAAVVLADRLVPQLHTQRVGDAFVRTLKKLGVAYDVIHLNRPGLAPWASPFGARLFVAGWFFPHAAGPRLAETWRHTRGFLPRRALITAKSLSYFAGDDRGYRAATSVVTCTEMLASQLRSQSLRAVACPPPVRVPRHEAAEYLPTGKGDGALHLLVCAGDLSHPRKNLNDAIRAAASLARPGRPVVMRAVGANSDALEPKAQRAKVAPGAHFELQSLGILSPAEVQREMRRSHALVLPSLYEEWGYVAIESILSGTPVISYPVYPFADLLTGGLGVVAEERTPTALAAAIERGLGLPRGLALVKAGEARFGSRAMGALLTQIWTDSQERPREDESAVVPSSLPAPPLAALPSPLPAPPAAALRPAELVASDSKRASARPSQRPRRSETPKSVRPARSDYPSA
jgi:glycosyltransferase involved in cell wall biosynthesis